MSLDEKAELKTTEPTGRTIARASARLMTAEEAKAVGGGLPDVLPSQATSSRCVAVYGGDYGGWDA